MVQYTSPPTSYRFVAFFPFVILHSGRLIFCFCFCFRFDSCIAHSFSLYSRHCTSNHKFVESLPPSAPRCVPSRSVARGLYSAKSTRHSCSSRSTFVPLLRGFPSHSLRRYLTSRLPIIHSCAPSDLNWGDPDMANTFSGSGPAHAQPSLPSLPAHLQSDTHLTAHLASRYGDPRPCRWVHYEYS